MILILTQHCLDESITDNVSLITGGNCVTRAGYVSGAPGEEDRKVTLDIAPPVSVYNYSSVSPDLPPSYSLVSFLHHHLIQLSIVVAKYY